MKRPTALFCLVLLTSQAAFAWDGTVAGKLAGIDVAGAGNYAFRINLQGGPSLCGNSNAWAYLDDSDANYKTYVATLLLARALGETVTVFTTRDASGYCKIGYLSLWNTM